MAKKLKDIFLLISVFATGAAVLVIEVVAMRILSPYFGNTIYTSSSVLGVVLAALSLGYYLGGRGADKFPLHIFFYGIICLSGLFVLFMQALIFSLLPILSFFFSISAGPLVASMVLFFVPAFCLGMLSPFAIKLHGSTALTASGSDGANIGKRSGEIFFWSTTGSIFGSLFSGFFLVPHFGLTAIILSTGVFLVVWGIAGLYVFGAPKVFLIAACVLAVYAALLVWSHEPKKNPATVYEKNGTYELVKIVDGEWQGRPARFLFQDRSYSAAMYFDSSELVYDYTKYYELYKLVNPDASRALVIGGGAYSIPKALLAESSAMRVDVAEIEPELLELAQRYFKFSPDLSRFQNYTEDGRRLLAHPPTGGEKPYDIIYSDVYYSLFSVPSHFTTQEFFVLAKSRLSSNGVFIANFGGFLQGEGAAFILSEIKTFNSVFPNHYYFAVTSPDSTKVQNIIFLGLNDSASINVTAVAQNFSGDFFAALPQKLIDEKALNIFGTKLMTDNYAPIEYLVGKIVGQW